MSDDGQGGAEKNGVRLRKVFAGIEVVDIRSGSAGGLAGDELMEAGFEVGDVITKIDNVSVIADGMSCAHVLRLIAEGHGGVGQALVEGFRRVAAFPRPTRTAISTNVARAAFLDKHDAHRGVEATHNLVGAPIEEARRKELMLAALAEENRVAQQMKNVKGNGHANGLNGNAHVSSSAASFSGIGSQAKTHAASAGKIAVTGPAVIYGATSATPGLEYIKDANEGTYPSTSSWKSQRGSVSWDPRALAEKDVGLTGRRGMAMSSLNPDSHEPGIRGEQLVELQPWDGFTIAAAAEFPFFNQALDAILDQLTCAENFLDSQDTIVDIRPFVRPLPDIQKSHKGAVACRAMRAHVLKLATLKEANYVARSDLQIQKTELEQAYNLVAEQKTVIDSLQLQVSDLDSVKPKEIAEAAAEIQQLEHAVNKSYETEKRLVEEKKVLYADLERSKADLANGLHAKEMEMMQLLEKRSRDFSDRWEAIEAKVQREMDSLERERQELHAQKQHEIEVLKIQLQRATVSLKEEHQTELLRERRLFEASKLQLTHQRDVLHRKLGETLDAEQDAKEREGQVQIINTDNQQTIAELQMMLDSLREAELQNQLTIQAQQHQLLAAQNTLTNCTEQLLMAERREKAQREHFEQVGKDNHATIKNLTDDLRFLAQQRELDYKNLLAQNRLNEEAWQRDSVQLTTQLNTMRSDVGAAVDLFNKRLGIALISARLLKPGVKKGGDKKPAAPGGRGGDPLRVEGASKEDLDELLTNLDEQKNIAAALQALMAHNKKLQESVQEWQNKAMAANALANQVALALQGQVNRKSIDMGNERSEVLRKQLQELNPDVKLDQGVAAYAAPRRGSPMPSRNSPQPSRDLAIGGP